MKNKKSSLLEFIKEPQETRKKRVSSGIKFRSVVFENKKKKLLDKYVGLQEDETP